MAEETEQPTNSDFPNASDNSNFSAKENALDSASEIVQSESGTNKKETKDYVSQPPTIIVNIPKEDNSEAVKANNLTRTSIIINSALFLITLAALWVTKQSVDISKDALNDSRKKDSVTEIKEKKIAFLDSIIRARDYIRDSTNIALSKQSLDAQIGTMQESQKQFNIQNKPYIQISAFDLSEIQIGHNVYFKYKVQNLGNQPIILLKRAVAISIVENLPFSDISKFKFLKTKIPPEEINRYIKGNPLENIFNSSAIFGQETYNGIVNKKLFFYFYGKFTYKNVVTGTKSVSEFLIYVGMKDGVFSDPADASVIYNNEYSIK